jgi:hypothetical protein
MNILEFIKTLPPKADKYFFGTRTAAQRVIAVYEKELPDETAVGEETKTRSVRLSILVHWNNRSDDTRAAAAELYNALKNVRNVASGDALISFVQLDNNAPVDVGTDGDGVFERVINCRIYYERND